MLAVPNIQLLLLPLASTLLGMTRVLLSKSCAEKALLLYLVNTSLSARVQVKEALPQPQKPLCNQSSLPARVRVYLFRLVWTRLLLHPFQKMLLPQLKAQQYLVPCHLKAPLHFHTMVTSQLP
mmetsp:Transcript_89335/g.186687  ORF Transcript_89335/g.186687 Transcript_89335/m.186687 type:complete len:123 (-) Transcript_89335:1123-1491(-)